MKNHILHILWDGHHGGVQRYVQKVVTADLWQENRHFILLLSEEGKVINTSTFIGVEVMCLNISSKFQIKRCHNSIQKLISQKNIDLIHCHCDSLFILAQLPFLKTCKMIYTEHGDSFVRNERHFISELLWKINGPTWDKIILNSPHTKNLFMQKFPYLAPAMEVVSNPLLEMTEKPLRELSHKPRIGTLGRLARVKGNDLFLQAAAIISKSIPQATFHIYGDGEEKNNLLLQTHKEKISSKVTFHGFTDQPLQEIQNLDCLVVPSRAESFGLVALEALAVGTPVAAFAGTGVTDFVMQNFNGAIAKMADTSQLAESVQYILSDKDNWKKLSTNGMKTVREQFSLKKHIQKLEHTYHRVLHEKQQKETA